MAAAGAGLTILAVRGATQIADGTGTGGAAGVFAALLVAAAACAVVAVLTSVAGVDGRTLRRGVARPLAITSGVIVVAAAAVFGPHLASTAWHSFTATNSTHPGTANVDPAARLTSLAGNRYPLWKVALKGFGGHPLNGSGAGTYQFQWYQHATTPETVRDAHNIWLQDLTELGVPGLLLILAVAGQRGGPWRGGPAPGQPGAERGRGDRVPGGIHRLSVPRQRRLDVAVHGGHGSRARRDRDARGPASATGKLRLNVPARVVLVLVALGAGALQLPGLLSTQAIRHSQAAERAGQGDLALGWAQNAVDAEPWSASAYQQRGLVLESAGQLRPAAADLKTAISYEPQNYEHWLLLSRIETERGHLDAAVSDYVRARELRPLSSAFALTSRPAAGGPAHGGLSPAKLRAALKRRLAGERVARQARLARERLRRHK